jgi:hypothetical protein
MDLEDVNVVAPGRLELPHPKIFDFESNVSTIPPQGHKLRMKA